MLVLAVNIVHVLAFTIALELAEIVLAFTFCACGYALLFTLLLQSCTPAFPPCLTHPAPWPVP